MACRNSSTTSDENGATGRAPAGKHYNVFISHRGPDTKKDFVDVLRHLLALRSLTSFLDCYSLKTGEESWATITDAIRNSDVIVVVLSKGFAESEWCLNEVCEIMKHRDTKAILPVFYDLQPSAFRLHFDTTPALSNRVPQQDIRKWQLAALDELSRITGFRTDETNGFIGQLADHVASRVAELIRPPIYMPASAQEKLRMQREDAERLLDLTETALVVSLGITGGAGAGMSTVAKLLFNSLCHRFGASCLLLDVKSRATASGGQLEKLQATLVRDLLKDQNLRVSHVDQGLGLLRERLRYTKCLVIVDDIDHDKRQLQYLLAMDKACLGPGSRLIITSRFRQVLTWASVDHTLLLPSFHAATIDIVISYHSQDVHEGFISQLYESFSMQGLRVSAENEEGESKSKAKLFVFVLSRGFVTSAKCLDELSARSLETESKCIAILYGLKQAGTPMEQHEGTQISWTYALQNIPTKDDLGNEFIVHLDETHMQKRNFKAMVTYMVSLVINNADGVQVGVTDFPVGVIERHEVLEKLMSIGNSNQVKTIGVLGMGGVGKTTLAKSLYRNLHQRFEAAAFLINVRAEANLPKGLEGLQRQIINQTVHAAGQFSGVEAGKVLLSRRLAGTNVLLVLDDVDDDQQLDALYRSTMLGPGSRVLITSRNSHILKEADEVYDVRLLSNEHARMLFYWHAFVRPYPPLQLQKVVQKVVDACQGLPLSLEVFGGLAYRFEDNSEEQWEALLLKLRKAQGKDLFAKLRISFDALEPEEQTAFLDVACFLVGKSGKTARRVWKACGWPAELHLMELKNRSLVKEDLADGRLLMHDQIRDMGRAIVDQPQQPHYRSHIWSPEGAKKVLETVGDGSSRIRGLAWITGEKKGCAADAICRPSDLHILLLSQLSITSGEFRSGTLSEIRWLQWHHYNSNSLHPGLCLGKLAVLDLSNSESLEGLWPEPQDPSTGTMPSGLMELNLSGCKGLKELPQFQFLRKLESLDAHGCTCLEAVPESIGLLEKLEFLDLHGCERLRYLPNRLAGLSSLVKLRLDGCKSLRRVPEDVGNLTRLKEISLDGTGVTRLPASFRKLGDLERLHLSHCRELVGLPSSIGGLRKLKVLHMRHCPKIKRLPEGVSKLSKLSELHVCYCNLLETLPESIGELENLRVLLLHHNASLAKLPSSIGKLGSLEHLDVGHCKLTNEGIPEEIGNLQSLKSLFASYNELRETLTTFTHLSGVVELEINHCGQLTHATSFPSRLKRLDIGDCQRLVVVLGLDPLKELESLVLCNCSELKELHGLEALGRLRELNISGCTKLRSAPGLSRLGSLKRLYLSGSGLIPSADQLQEVPSIEHVSIYASEMPSYFKKRMKREIEQVEYACRKIMTVSIPASADLTRLGVIMCVVSHDQGWSDNPHSHGRYPQTPSFVEAVIKRNGFLVRREVLFWNRHADSREQLNFIVLRAGHALLKGLRGNDDLVIRARTLYQAWRITVKQASMMLMPTEAQLNTHLQMIAKDIRWAALYSRTCRSLVLGDANCSLRGLAAMDPAGLELTRGRTTSQNNFQLELLDLIWQPDILRAVFIHPMGSKGTWVWVPFPLFFGHSVDLESVMRDTHLQEVPWLILPMTFFGKMHLALGRLRFKASLLRPSNDRLKKISYLQTTVKVAQTRMICRNVGLDMRCSRTPQQEVIEPLDELYSHSTTLRWCLTGADDTDGR